MKHNGISRRVFGRAAALLGAGTTLPFINEFALAQLSQVRGMPADAVRLNANENPMGPCREALEAMAQACQSGRYQYEFTDTFQSTLAELEGLVASNVAPFPGSAAPLHQGVIAFTSPSRAFVVADPGYEAGERAAGVVGAPVTRVPLRKDFAHDVKAMAAVPNAGLIYVCNPNNPTGSLTPKADIEWLVANKPAGAVVMVDEAYIHFAGSPSCTDLVAKGQDVIVLRTFSKLYGMAGIRAGAAIARPDLLAKVRAYHAGAMPAPAMAAAIASLRSKQLVPERSRIVKDIREDVISHLDRKNYRCVPSVSNKFMVDLGRPGQPVVQALSREKVYVGRIWPSWPNHVRVTIGTAEEMSKFKAAFAKVMA